MPKTSNPTNRIDARLSLIVNRRDSRETREQQDAPRDTSERARNRRDIIIYRIRNFDFRVTELMYFPRHYPHYRDNFPSTPIASIACRIVQPSRSE